MLVITQEGPEIQIYSLREKIHTEILPKYQLYLDYKIGLSALARVAQWIEHHPATKGSGVGFPIRAHAWVLGQVPSGGRMRGNHTLMFLYLSFSLLSPLSKNR